MQSWQLKTGALAQAENRAGKTRCYLQWWDSGVECRAVTSAGCKVCNCVSLFICMYYIFWVQACVVVICSSQGARYTTSVYSNNTTSVNDNITLLTIYARRFAFRHIRTREFVEWIWIQACQIIENEKHIMMWLECYPWKSCIFKELTLARLQLFHPA